MAPKTPVTFVNLQGQLMGNEVSIARAYEETTLTIRAGTAITTSGFEFSKYAGGSIRVRGATWTAASIGFTSDGSAVYDEEDDTLIEIAISAADRWYPLPAKLFCIIGKIRLWSETAGAGVNQVGADRVIDVKVKG